MRERSNVVLLAARGATSYAVLKALYAMGARVQLICDCRSSIQFSRYARIMYVSKDLRAESPRRILELINDGHRRTPIDFVLASDVAGTMLLNVIRAELLAPAFPAADNAILRVLDNKWSFNQLCLAIGVSVPDSILFDCKERVDPARIERELGYPVVVKPVDQSGGDGVVVIGSREALSAQVLSGSYGYGATGVMVQRYVKGRDWGYSAFAVNGRVEAALTFACGPKWETEFRTHPDLLDTAARIVEHLHYTGVLNFDCRLDDETKTFKFLECNPRFFRRVTASRLCGVNFVKAAFRAETHIPDGVWYFLPRHMFTREGANRLAQGRWPLAVLGADLFETLSDPIPGLVQNAAWAETAHKTIAPLLQRLVPYGLRARRRHV
jgi:carbamoylphosphate synthase large subunit